MGVITNELGTVICDQCYDPAENYKVCPHCGNDLGMSCKKCGHEIPVTWQKPNFCPGCGESIQRKVRT